MATCVPGIESVVTGEIKAVFKEVNNVSETRGKVIFDCAHSDMSFENLKCVDNLYKLFRVFTVGTHKDDLAELGACVKDIVFGIDGRPPFRIIVSASRSG